MSADVADAAVLALSDDDDVPSAVELTRAVPQADVICVHVDEPAAATDVALAAGGDEEAAATPRRAGPALVRRVRARERPALSGPPRARRVCFVT